MVFGVFVRQSCIAVLSIPSSRHTSVMFVSASAQSASSCLYKLVICFAIFGFFYGAKITRFIVFTNISIKFMVFVLKYLFIAYLCCL